MVAVAPVGAAQRGRLEVASAESGSVVVNGLVVGGCAELSLGTETTRVGMELGVDCADSPVVKTGGSECVLGLVERLGVEDFAGLLGEGLAEVVVVDPETGNVALVSREDSGLSGDGSLKMSWKGGSYFGRHIVGGGAVEVLLGPLEEVLLLVDFPGFGVGNIEFGN